MAARKRKSTNPRPAKRPRKSSGRRVTKRANRDPEQLAEREQLEQLAGRRGRVR